jgi:hypothetical protein
MFTYVFVFPSTTRSGISLEIKSSSDGPCSSVSLKVFPSVRVDDPTDVAAGVASRRICLDTETRATCEFLRMNDICVAIVDRTESFAWNKYVVPSGTANSEISAPESRADTSPHQDEHPFSTRGGNTIQNDKGSCPQGMRPISQRCVLSNLPFIRQRHSLCSIRRLCCWTYGFGCLGLQGEVQCRSGLHLPVVSVLFFIHLINSYAPSTRPESMQLVRDEYLRIRNEQQEQLPS